MTLVEIRTFLETAKRGAGYGAWDVGCRITSDAAIRRLNKRYRGVDAPTDILSFAFHELKKPEEWPAGISDEERNLGDMVISHEYVAAWCARNAPITEKQRYAELLTHGLVHLMGYDHETEEQFAVMQARERAVLAAATAALRDAAPVHASGS